MTTKLRQTMEHQGRRHVWLAAATGVSPSHVTRVMNGEREPSPRFKRIAAEALGVALEDLFPQPDEVTV